MTITVVEPESQVMYRLYNPNNKEHFYTASLHEKDTLVDIGWGFYEGLLGRHQVRVSLFIAFTILFLRIIIIPWINMKSVFYRASMVGKKKGLLGTREVLKRYIASSIRAWLLAPITIPLMRMRLKFYKPEVGTMRESHGMVSSLTARVWDKGVPNSIFSF